MHAQVPDPQSYLAPEALAELEAMEREQDECNIASASQQSTATPKHAIKRGVSSAALLASSASSSSLPSRVTSASSSSLPSRVTSARSGSKPGFKDDRCN